MKLDDTSHGALSAPGDVFMDGLLARRIRQQSYGAGVLNYTKPAFTPNGGPTSAQLWPLGELQLSQNLNQRLVVVPK